MSKSVVFNFHKETDAARFEKILLALKAKFKFADLATLEQSFNAKKEFEGVCHISFDDGERSFYELVFPLLQKHNVPASLFVSPKIISENSNYWFQDIEAADPVLIKTLLAAKTKIPLLQLKEIPNEMIFKSLPIRDILDVVQQYKNTCSPQLQLSNNISLQQLKEMDASGLVTIGAHTLNHPILQNESASSSENEITGSVQQLSSLLGHPVKCFAYPNGRPGLDFSEREKQLLRDNGITMCFSTELGHLSVNADRLAIPRMGFAMMGLQPSNPLVYARIRLGKKWPAISMIGKPTEKELRSRVRELIGIAENKTAAPKGTAV